MARHWAVCVAALAAGACGNRGTTGADASPDGSFSADAGSDAGGIDGGGDAGPVSLPPRIFYSDLQSGPSSGGQGGKGLFVTVYGQRFGSAQGSSAITIGGGQADNYPLWTDSRIVFQLGPNAASGNIMVNVAGTGPSNPVPFTVRAGGIYFVAPTGSDSAPGSYAQPWKTLTYARSQVTAGDTIYAMDGVAQTSLDSSGAALVLNAPVSEMPIALVAYPLATVTVGDPNAVTIGILVSGASDAGGSWVLAGLSALGSTQALLLQGAQGARVVANALSCPSGNGQAGCMETVQSDQVAFLGNDVSNVSANNQGSVSRGYHAVFFSTDSNQIEAGWNRVHDSFANCGMLFSSTPAGAGTGFNEHDILVHDNVIHDIRGDGIDFDTVDPSQGTAQAYNNVIYNVGTGPDFPEGSTDYTCMDVAGTPATNGEGSGILDLFNNTCVNPGSRGGSAAGAFLRGAGSAGLTLRLRNDLVSVASGESYLAPATTLALVVGNNNLWFGAGTPPTIFQASVNADPLFVNGSAFDFHLQSGSPAVDSGINTGIDHDFDGVPRPQGAAYDIGAYELVK
jgi:hypothetical protein